MVSTSRLKRAQDRVVSARPYAAALTEVIRELYDPELAERFPLLRRETEFRRSALILITSNRGLCGSFNSNLIKEARQRIAGLEEQGTEVDLHLIGRKGMAFFKYIRRKIASGRQDIGDKPTPDHSGEVASPVIADFEAGRIDAVDIVFAKFNSPVSTPPMTMRILPLDLEQVESAGPAGGSEARVRISNYILSPSADRIVGAILPLYIRNTVYRALAETAASEHGARRTAMKNATDNAGEMLDNLRRTFNRARQAQITQELAEVMGGAEALEG